MILGIFQTIARPLFGVFEKEEFKKFLRLGLIFAFIIGSYWTMRVLKDSLFINLVDKTMIPWAKTVSLLCLVPIVIFYTKLLDKFTREKMFYMLIIFYSVMLLVFALCILSPTFGQTTAALIAERTGFAYYATKVLGFVWYVFVESFGSLVVALFWAITASTTLPESAKKGFPLVVAVGQLGGIIGPMLISGLPHKLGFSTSALSIFLCSITVGLLVVFMRYFMSATPKELLVSFHGKNEEEKEGEQEPGFFEGLKLLLKHKYLLGIFIAISCFEIIVTIFDFHFKMLAGGVYTGTALDAYLGSYGSMVNTISLVCLLLGVSNITRLLGVGVALAMVPVILGGALVGFITLDSLPFLFWLMVSSKAINYALNGPALKQLYIPTTHDARFKAQAWIETFGSRLSKSIGSGVNMTLKPLQTAFGPAAGKAYHVLGSSIFGFALVGTWFVIAVLLGRTYKHAIDEKKVIC